MFSLGSCHCPAFPSSSFTAASLWLIFASARPGKFQNTLPVGYRRLTNRRAANGHTVDELPFKAAFGVWGSYVCLIINVLSLIAQFYVALYPVGGPNLDPTTFFELYLAGPFLIALYLIWKVYSWFKRPSDRPLFVKIKDIDIYTGMRDTQRSISGAGMSEDQRRASVIEMQGEKKKKTPMDYIMGPVKSIF
jgi:amino acid transporter